MWVQFPPGPPLEEIVKVKCTNLIFPSNSPLKIGETYDVTQEMFQNFTLAGVEGVWSKSQFEVVKEEDWEKKHLRYVNSDNCQNIKFDEFYKVISETSETTNCQPYDIVVDTKDGVRRQYESYRFVKEPTPTTDTIYTYPECFKKIGDTLCTPKVTAPVEEMVKKVQEQFISDSFGGITTPMFILGDTSNHSVVRLNDPHKIIMEKCEICNGEQKLTELYRRDKKWMCHNCIKVKYNIKKKYRWWIVPALGAAGILIGKIVLWFI